MVCYYYCILFFKSEKSKYPINMMIENLELMHGVLSPTPAPGNIRNERKQRNEKYMKVSNEGRISNEENLV